MKYVVDYINAGYCTPTGTVDGCQVEIGPAEKGSVVGGAKQAVKFGLCSQLNTICGTSASNATPWEGTLTAQDFPSVAAGTAFLVTAKASGSWSEGWQLNQWALLVSALPATQLTRLTKSLDSAVVIVNGQSYLGKTPPDDLRRAF